VSLVFSSLLIGGLENPRGLGGQERETCRWVAVQGSQVPWADHNPDQMIAKWFVCPSGFTRCWAHVAAQCLAHSWKLDCRFETVTCNCPLHEGHHQPGPPAASRKEEEREGTTQPSLRTLLLCPLPIGQDLGTWSHLAESLRGNVILLWVVYVQLTIYGFKS
jgi:hypothetical protein